MPSLNLAQTQTVAELAQHLYSFLPGSGAPYTWQNVAADNHVAAYWVGGSKLPAITQLLELTLANSSAKFCPLVTTAVRGGLKYRLKKKEPVQRAEIEELNRLLLLLSFKIPELHDVQFLNGLPGNPAARPAPQAVSPASAKPIEAIDFRQIYMQVCQEKDPQKRGYAFEGFLNKFFAAQGLAPRGSFRVLGEQIDGSFVFEGATFVIEARWRALPANAADLFVLRAKAEKSEWTRGLFISINGFSDIAADTFRTGRKANLIAMSGQDLMLILDQRWTLVDALREKLRHTGETGDVFLSLASVH